jgi:hypothetical protein
MTTPLDLDAMRADATFARIFARRARRKADDPAEVEHALASAETCAAHVLALAGEVERLTAAAVAAKTDREADPCPGSRGF